MATRLNILRRSKRVEQEVAEYFWPNHEEDETGSVRDWKELWDVSGPDCNGVPVVCEVKSVKWPTGTGQLWGLLNEAYDQLAGAIYKADLTAEPTLCVVVWKPTNTSIEDAICYLRYWGAWVAMPAEQFKEIFIEGENDD